MSVTARCPQGECCLYLYKLSESPFGVTGYCFYMECPNNSRPPPIISQVPVTEIHEFRVTYSCITFQQRCYCNLTLLFPSRNVSCTTIKEVRLPYFITSIAGERIAGRVTITLALFLENFHHPKLGIVCAPGRGVAKLSSDYVTSI